MPDDKTSQHSKVVFRHYRHYDSIGIISPKGGSTVALMKDDTGYIKFAFSYCRDTEVFVKRLGCQIAKGRLSSKVPTGLWGYLTSANHDLQTAVGRRAVFDIVERVRRAYIAKRLSGYAND